MFSQSWHLKGCQDAAINKDDPFRELQASLDELKERGSDLVPEEIDAHSWVDLESDLTKTTNVRCGNHCHSQDGSGGG